MMDIARVLLTSALLATTAADEAQVTMKPEDVVTGRRAAYYLSGTVVSNMKFMVEGGGDPKDQVFGANALANWARRLPQMFPPGSNVPPTHANPNVWTDRAGFESKAKDYADAAQKLADIAATGDRAAFLAQLSLTRATCDSCHFVYHRKEQTSDGKQ